MTGLEVAALITAVAAIVMNLLALRNLKILRANRSKSEPSPDDA